MILLRARERNKARTSDTLFPFSITRIDYARHNTARYEENRQAVCCVLVARPVRAGFPETSRFRGRTPSQGLM